MNINIRLSLSFLLFAAGLAAFYFLSAQPTVVSILVLLGAIGFSIGVFSKTSQGQETIGFINNAVTEAKKVVWPTRRETTQMTLVVIVVVVIMAVFLGLVDTGFSYIINLLLGRGN
jgi:preprotein translocase subunit SecE